MTHTNNREQERAALARCLTLWIDPDGQKIPGDETGIAHHKELVEEYEALFGDPTASSRAQYEGTYAAIRESVEAEAAANAEAQRVMDEYAASHRKETERLAAEDFTRRVTMAYKGRIQDANVALQTAAISIPMFQIRLGSQRKKVANLESREADTRRRMESLAKRGWGSSRLYRRLVAGLPGLAAELAGAQEELEERTEEFDAAVAKRDAAQKFLAEPPPPGVELQPEPPPKPEPPEVEVQRDVGALPEPAPSAADDMTGPHVPVFQVTEAVFRDKGNGFLHIESANAFPVQIERNGRRRDSIILARSGFRVKVWGALGPDAAIQFDFLDGDHIWSRLECVKTGQYRAVLSESDWLSLASHVKE